MKTTIFGAGYVGLVTGACLAERGHDVLCVDVNEARVAMLQAGKSPIYEPGLDELLAKNQQAGRLAFTTDVAKAVQHGAVQFIAVGTPPDEDGSADLQYVLAVAKSIGQHMQDYKVIIDKSTVPVGTADKVATAIAAETDKAFAVVSNPEFLKEGAAIPDFMQPDRIVIGVEDDKARDVMRELYKPFTDEGHPLVETDIRSAELSKYAANAMLATKISFMNELSHVAERVGADIEKVRHAISLDRRIGPYFISPGCGYGGSCFPKDVKALIATSKSEGYTPQLLDAVEAVNAAQKHTLLEKINAHFKGDVKNKTFALWGLSFKPNTDDMREATSRVVIEKLQQAGASVQAYDPVAMEEAQRLHPDLTLCETKEAALQGADALVIVTEWQHFREPDFDGIKAALSSPVIFDGRNLFDLAEMNDKGITYYSIGRACQQVG